MSTVPTGELPIRRGSSFPGDPPCPSLQMGCHGLQWLQEAASRHATETGVFLRSRPYWEQG